jgi:hypothetical protein
MIKAILGNYFFQKDVTQDLEQGTDFLIFIIKPIKVGVRLRRYPYLLKYPKEFTIRYKRPSGVKTEYQKIKEGYVDYILYGFLNSDGSRIIQYFIGDLEVFRWVDPAPLFIKPNIPYDSDFAVYSLDQFPDNFIKKFYTRSERG